MATNPMNRVLRHLCSAVRRPGPELTDGQLLGRYLQHRDEAAFATLVQRQAPMVWGVCRRLLPNSHDAEDAFQATFLVLVRKAAAVRPREMVANWLFGVAHQTARKARATTARRRTRERQVTPMPEREAGPAPDPWPELLPLLDQELSRLPDKYRVAIVLCDLEGRTRKAAARQLGVPEGTLAARLARARTMLAKRLTQRGLVVSGGALAAVMAQQAASASVPVSVVSSTVKAVTLVAAGQAAAGVVSAPVAALTEGVLKAMLLTKLKAVVTLVLVLGMVVVGGGLFTYSTAAGEKPTAKPAAEEAKRAAEVEQANDRVEAATARLRQAVEQLERAKAEFEQAKAVRDAAKALSGVGRQPPRPVPVPPVPLPAPPAPPVPPLAPPPVTDQERMQGAWYFELIEAAGVPAPFRGKPQEDADRQVVITGDRLNTILFKGGKGFTFKLDPSTQPKTIDLRPLEDAQQTALGIYALDGDELKICFSFAAGKPKRPEAFVTKAGQENMLLVLRRYNAAQVKPYMYTTSRQFQIPVASRYRDLAEREKVKELQLFVSDDEGKTWRKAAGIGPDEKVFPFEAPRDGLYWFAVRVVKNDGTIEPSDLFSVQADLKVRIDAGKPQPPLKAADREYVIVARLMEAGADQPKSVLTFPKVTAEEEQVVPIHIPDGQQNLLGKVIDDEKLKVGTFLDMRVKRLGGNKVRLFLSFQRNEVEKTDVSEIRVLGNSVQAIQDVELHKPVKLVFQKDAKGSAQWWIEIVVDEQIAP